jgi:hypothetical protein
VDVRMETGDPYYCDAGAHIGMMAVQFRGTAYLTDEELAACRGELAVTLPAQGGAPDEKEAHDGHES